MADFYTKGKIYSVSRDEEGICLTINNTWIPGDQIIIEGPGNTEDFKKGDEVEILINNLSEGM